MKLSSKFETISLRYTNICTNTGGTKLYLKMTNMVDFSHMCVFFTKHLNTSKIFGKYHTCVVFTS